MMVTLAAASATFGSIYARASELRSRSRALQARVPDVPRCERSEHREPSEPWTIELFRAIAVDGQIDGACHPFRWLPISLRLIARHRAPVTFCRGRRCGGDLWRSSHHSERVAKQTSCTPKRASCEAGRERSKHGCPMSRGVNEVNTESHRNRGRLSCAGGSQSTVELTAHIIRSDGCRSHFVRSPDIGHP
jgi:hypothetical protein